MGAPIPLSAIPRDGDTPAGSIPVSIYGLNQNARAAGVPLYALGTSYTVGANASTPAQEYVNLVADAIGSTEVHNVAAGSTNSTALVGQASDDPDGWVPGTSTGAVIIEAGIGESLAVPAGRVAQSRRAFESSIRTTLRWHRASAVRKFGHPSIALGSGATTETIASSGIHLTPGIKLDAPGEYFTITVGSGVNEIVLLASPWNHTAEVENGAYSISYGSVTLNSTTVGMGDASASPILLTLSSDRLTGLTPGEVITVTKVGGGKTWFYGYLEMSATTVPPVVLVGGVPVPDADATAVQVFQAILRDVAASPEFSNVAVADPSRYWDNTTDTHADDTHPDNEGHVVYARAVTAAFQGMM